MKFTNIAIVTVALAIAAYMYLHLGQSFHPESIANKHVLITGASSGIGEQLAYQYSRLGAKIFITARRRDLLASVAKRCLDLGARQVEFVTSDLGQQSARHMLMTEVSKRFGGLDHLVLNHATVSNGLWLGSRGNLSTLVEDINVNFVSYVDLASQALPMLMESKGNIGILSSVAGKFAFGGMGPYCASKFALQGFFSALRLELDLRKTGISVTTCVIGPVDTDLMKFTEEKRMELKKSAFLGYRFLATTEDTAIAVIAGIAAREAEVYYATLAWVMVRLHQLLPSLVEKYISVASIPSF